MAVRIHTDLGRERLQEVGQVPYSSRPKGKENEGLDEEALIIWQDVLDEVAAGRSGSLSCPKCGHTPLEVSRTATGRTKITCSKCGEYLEGRFGAG